MKYLLIILLYLFCASCGEQNGNTQAGFWLGFAQGLLIYISWIFLIFSDYQIYSVINTGMGYDVGFIFGIALINVVYFQQKIDENVTKALQKYIVKPQKDKE